MSSSTLYRLSGVALLLGALLTLVSAALHLLPPFDQLTSPLWVPLSLLFLLASMLVVLGLPGMYVRQAGRTGLLGLIGFVLTVLLWLILGVGGQTIDAFVLPWLVGNVATRPLLDAGAPWEVFFVVGPVLALVGPLLLGLVTMRAGVLPRGAGLLLFVSSLLDGTAYVPLPSPIGTLIESAGLVLFCLGLAWLGYALLSLQGPEVGQSRLAAAEASR